MSCRPKETGVLNEKLLWYPPKGTNIPMEGEYSRSMPKMMHASFKRLGNLKRRSANCCFGICIRKFGEEFYNCIRAT